MKTNRLSQRPLCFLMFLAIAASGLYACGPDGTTETPDSACKDFVAGDLVITEFMADAEGSDTGKEWIEIYNATKKEVDLKGLTLVAARPDGSREKRHTIAEGKIKPAGYFVLGDSVEKPLPAHIDYSYGDGLGALGNESGLIAIRCGTVKIDEVKYTTPVKPGASRLLSGSIPVPDSAVNDLEENFCDATIENVPGILGSPGAANEACATVAPEGTCIDFVGEARPIVRPSPGELVITEFLANPKAPIKDTNGEWFEVYALAPVDLNELVISNGGTKNFTIKTANCLRLEAGQYAVLASKSEPEINGGIANVFAPVSISLGNTGGVIIITSGEIEIDRVAYTTSKDGVAAQLDPQKMTALDNDDVANFCDAVDPYGTGDNLGTPGAANKDCPVPPDPNNCNDNGQSRPIDPPAAGDLIITEFMPNPKKAEDSYGEYVELFVKRDLDLNGVEIRNEGTGRFAIESADCLRVPANSHILFVRNTDPEVNGGIADAYGVLGLSLSNNKSRKIIVQRGEVPIDEVSYNGSTEGKSTQLDIGKYDATLNDEASSFCLSTTQYGASHPVEDKEDDYGTPGLPNGACQ
ncbi:MAG: lamin tail domain-containing protein [Myxococcales bacterium]|jgi:hypothetical protein